MSLKKLHDEVTPKDGSSILGWIVAIGIELLAKLGPVGVFAVMCLFLVFIPYGVYELVKHFA